APVVVIHTPFCLPSPHALSLPTSLISVFLFNAPPPPEIYTLSLHDALPIYNEEKVLPAFYRETAAAADEIVGAECEFIFVDDGRSEEHTSELQSRFDLVCRLLLEKKKYKEEESPSSRYPEVVCE